MNILILSPYITTNQNEKFYQSQQINLANELIKLSFNVSLITSKRNSEDSSYSKFDNLEIYRLNAIKKPIEKVFNQVILLGLYKKLKSLDFDIILI